LQQEIAELLAQVRQAAARDRVGDLVGFLDRVWRDRLEILLEVPRTTRNGRAQGRHDRNQLVDVTRGLHRIGLPVLLNRERSTRPCRPRIPFRGYFPAANGTKPSRFGMRTVGSVAASILSVSAMTPLSCNR